MRCAQESRGELEILTLELDPRVLEASAKLYAAGSVEARLIGALRRDGYYAENGIRVTLLTGDARQSVRQLDGPFDVIFQDGFSPDCNPELWSYDFVRELARRLAPGGVLTSYCSAFPFRGALLRSGLQAEARRHGRRLRSGAAAGAAAGKGARHHLPLHCRSMLPRSVAHRHPRNAFRPAGAAGPPAAEPRSSQVVQGVTEIRLTTSSSSPASSSPASAARFR